MGLFIRYRCPASISALVMGLLPSSQQFLDYTSCNLAYLLCHSTKRVLYIPNSYTYGILLDALSPKVFILIVYIASYQFLVILYQAHLGVYLSSLTGHAQVCKSGILRAVPQNYLDTCLAVSRIVLITRAYSGSVGLG